MVSLIVIRGHKKDTEDTKFILPLQLFNFLICLVLPCMFHFVCDFFWHSKLNLVRGHKRTQKDMKKNIVKSTFPLHLNFYNYLYTYPGLCWILFFIQKLKRRLFQSSPVSFMCPRCVLFYMKSLDLFLTFLGLFIWLYIIAIVPWFGFNAKSFRLRIV